LGGITIFNGALGLLRSTWNRAPASSRQRLVIQPGHVVTILFAGVIVAGSLLVARNGALNQPRPGFTQLWMLPGETPNSVQIGVKNEEAESVSYWLVVRQGETPIEAYYEMQVDAGATWTAVVPLPVSAVNAQQPVEAQLYRSNQPDNVYRNVTLWVSKAHSK
jgi:hypothetical protein